MSKLNLRPRRAPDFFIVSTARGDKTDYVKPWGSDEAMRYTGIFARTEVGRLKSYVGRCERAGQQPTIRPNCIVRVYLK